MNISDSSKIQYQDYIKKMKVIHKALFSFLENDDINKNDDYYFSLKNLLIEEKILLNHHEFKTFLHLLAEFSAQHHRGQYFIKNIEDMLRAIKYEVKNNFENYEIFKIFQNNKRILLFLSEEKILNIDCSIFKLMTEDTLKQNFYPQYFYPEIKEFLKPSDRRDIHDENSEDFKYFKEKRKIGENDEYLYQLIRTDSVKEFITYTNLHNIDLTSTIKPSIFETNSFLLEHKETTLVEYAAFFGSIQIIRYYVQLEIKLNPSIWIYAIHSNSDALIYFLERIIKDDEMILKSFHESIKCNHNQIANYIKDTYFFDSELSSIKIFQSYNFKFFDEKSFEDFPLRKIIKYDYTLVFDLVLKEKIIDLTLPMILNNLFQ